jgi:NADPH:quinone reductase-like Zn-dependent oxidoreductase
MKAGRIHRFGPPAVVVVDEIGRPAPGEGELVVETAFAGVGPWDALIREGKSAVDVEPPIILGSDVAGVVAAVGPAVTGLKQGDGVYGGSNRNFCGGYAEYAVVAAGMAAAKPKRLNFAEAASAPVVAVTAWQMVFEYADVKAGQRVLIHGTAGNVGANAVQLAKHAGAEIYATAAADDAEYVKGLGAGSVIDYKAQHFEEVVPPVDAVIDLAGGETRQRSFAVLKPGGILVSVVSPIPEKPPQPAGVRSVFFLVEVTTARLEKVTELFDRGELKAAVGTVLPLEQARRAHEMLGGAPHARGKLCWRCRTSERYKHGDL